MFNEFGIENVRHQEEITRRRGLAWCWIGGCRHLLPLKEIIVLSLEGLTTVGTTLEVQGQPHDTTYDKFHVLDSSVIDLS